MNLEINLFTWFQDRELDSCPNHFVMAKTPITEESLLWVEEKLSGRYSIISELVDDMGFYSKYPAFEDPKDLVLYELTWSS